MSAASFEASTPEAVTLLRQPFPQWEASLVKTGRDFPPYSVSLTNTDKRDHTTILNPKAPIPVVDAAKVFVAELKEQGFGVAAPTMPNSMHTGLNVTLNGKSEDDLKEAFGKIIMKDQALLTDYEAYTDQKLHAKIADELSKKFLGQAPQGVIDSAAHTVAEIAKQHFTALATEVKRVGALQFKQ